MIGLLLLLLFNYPLLTTVNKPLLYGGVPLLYIYVGSVWLVAIILLFLTTRRFPGSR